MVFLVSVYKDVKTSSLYTLGKVTRFLFHRVRAGEDLRDPILDEGPEKDEDLRLR